MAFKIGFMADCMEKQEGGEPVSAQKPATAPKKSVVQVQFPGKGVALAYYNDRFDLRRGDLVYVDGKLEGIQGRVVDISYNFKIKTSEYKKVIAVVDTDVRGELFMAGSHFVSFDPAVLPYSKVLGWFRAPVRDEEYESGSDDTSFPLHDLHQLHVSADVAQRGYDYYLENRVRYLSLDGDRGKAILEGTKSYEVEFLYRDGQISNLLCDCFCTGHCKHEVAAMLQLRETLELMEKHHPGKLAENNYFAAVCKMALFRFVLDGREIGRITL